MGLPSVIKCYKQSSQEGTQEFALGGFSSEQINLRRLDRS
jgi:hypothetical protein